MHVSINRMFIDDEELTHRVPILRGVVRMIGSSSIIPYESLVGPLRVNQTVEERPHSFRPGLVGLYERGINTLHTEIQTNHGIAIISNSLRSC